MFQWAWWRRRFRFLFEWSRGRRRRWRWSWWILRLPQEEINRTLPEEIKLCTNVSDVRPTSDIDHRVTFGSRDRYRRVIVDRNSVRSLQRSLNNESPSPWGSARFPVIFALADLVSPFSLSSACQRPSASRSLAQ